MKKCMLFCLCASLLLFMGCNKTDDGNAGDTALFKVTIKNVVKPTPIFQSGVFNIPVSASEPGPLFPGDSYEFEVDAGLHVLPVDGGTRLSFVTMFVQSNDLFFAPGEGGIALYDDDGNPIGASGPEDVTDQVLLWDAGTEVNEETGGPNQKPQQVPDAEDQGEDENGVVTELTGNMDVFGNEIPDNDKVIEVTIENTAPAKFMVKIMNVSTPNTIKVPAKGDDATAPVPLSPGAYAVHTKPAPFFKEGEAAAGAGLVASMEGVEDIAEDGFPQALAMDTKAKTGLIVPMSPGVWATHESGTMPIYEFGAPDFGEGLEGIAEDGKPMNLVEALNAKPVVINARAINTPDGSLSPGPIAPGASYSFQFAAKKGESLSFATMFIQSNDWFYAFRPDGLPLFEDGKPVSGNVTDKVYLYDAGTEIDEYPGAGLSQVIRQPELNFGAADPDNSVRLIKPEDFENVPEKESVIKVTISSTRAY